MEQHRPRQRRPADDEMLDNVICVRSRPQSAHKRQRTGPTTASSGSTLRPFDLPRYAIPESFVTLEAVDPLRKESVPRPRPQGADPSQQHIRNVRLPHKPGHYEAPRDPAAPRPARPHDLPAPPVPAQPASYPPQPELPVNNGGSSRKSGEHGPEPPSRIADMDKLDVDFNSFLADINTFFPPTPADTDTRDFVGDASTNPIPTSLEPSPDIGMEWVHSAEGPLKIAHRSAPSSAKSRSISVETQPAGAAVAALDTIDARLDHVFKAVAEADFDSLDDALLTYYKQSFEGNDRSRQQQRLSRIRRLPALLFHLHQTVRTWDQSQRRAFQEQMVRSTEDILIAELEGHLSERHSQPPKSEHGSGQHVRARRRSDLDAELPNTWTLLTSLSSRYSSMAARDWPNDMPRLVDRFLETESGATA